ncbi:hypothetical protein TanjilG_31190 [Lupinus angustifolius]|uniref:Uncharacterized protein n=1 Tax=Lupinus angustifolius TaxID=3871 RepID=A0A1J7HGM3_LUPAN|nr:hypothetical protein TanjilG_31190 [Lupinus angustifolius]
MVESITSEDNRSEIAELKAHMSGIFNMLKTLQSEKGKINQTVNMGPQSNPAQLPKGNSGQGAGTSQQKEEATKWPFYGMPPNYVPHSE